MLEKLEAIYTRFKQVEEQLSQPDVLADMKRFTQMNREYKSLHPIIDKYFEYKNLVGNIQNVSVSFGIEGLDTLWHYFEAY